MGQGLKRLGGAAMLALTLCGPAVADRFQDDLVGQLHAQGYTDVEVTRTLLGRIRVVATSATVYREIVVNPRTGEILRDYSELLDSDEIETPTLLNTGSGSNSGSGSSGSGSSGSGSNSGSGSSGSGSSGSGSNSGSGGSGSNSGSGSSGSGSSGSGSSGGGHSGGSDDDGSGG